MTAALAQAGIVAWSLSADVCRQFNRFTTNWPPTAAHW